MYGRNLEEAGKSGAGPRDHRAGDDQLADGQPLRQRGARIAAGDAGGETEGGARHQHVQNDGEQNADREAPVHVGTGDRADHVVVADREGRGLVGGAWIAQRAFDEEVHDGDGDVGQKQRGDRLVDAALVAQVAGEPDPDGAGRDGGQRHHGQQHDRRRVADQRQGDCSRREPREHERALPADHDETDAGGDGHRQRGVNEGSGALQGVLDGERRAEAAAPDELVEVQRRLADQQEKGREQRR